jgi:hypothetical protein
MRKLVLGIAAAATLLVALPVAAQIQPVPSHHGFGGMIGGIPAWTADPITAGFIMTVAR